ncbi:MAG: hypothetical protein Q4B17_00315 [Lautropia sp.]|nr:hypothetical protein [Lautropia sp.]
MRNVVLMVAAGFVSPGIGEGLSFAAGGAAFESLHAWSAVDISMMRASRAAFVRKAPGRWTAGDDRVGMEIS